MVGVNIAPPMMTLIAHRCRLPADTGKCGRGGHAQFFVIGRRGGTHTK
jgi:hypothetical protein